jgi:hypothetical protein
MSKNQIFTSPLGIGLGIGIGTAVGSIIIGAITYTIFKYSKGSNGDSDDYSDSNGKVSRSSSMFSYPENSIYDRNSDSENNTLAKYTSAFNKDAPSYGHKKVLGGKSKKIKRKRKRNRKNNTLKKV